MDKEKVNSKIFPINLPYLGKIFSISENIVVNKVQITIQYKTPGPPNIKADVTPSIFPAPKAS